MHAQVLAQTRAGQRGSLHRPSQGLHPPVQISHRRIPKESAHGQGTPVCVCVCQGEKHVALNSHKAQRRAHDVMMVRPPHWQRAQRAPHTPSICS